MRALLRKLLGVAKRELSLEREFWFGPSKRELRDRIVDVNGSLNRANCRIVELNGDKASLINEKNRLKREVEDLTIERDTARVMAQRWEERVDRQTKDIERLTHENGVLKTRHETGDRYVKLLADEKERLRLRVQSLREELDAVVATASESAAEHKVYVCQAEAEESGLHSYIDAVDAMISGALEKIGAFPPKPAGQADRVDAICNTLVAFKEDLDVVYRRNEELNDKIRTLEIALEASAELEKKWKRQRATLKRRLDSLRRYTETSDDEATALREENNKLRKESDRIRSESEHVENTCRELRIEIDRLKGEIDIAAASFVRTLEQQIKAYNEVRLSRDDLYAALSDMIRLLGVYDTLRNAPFDAVPGPTIAKARSEAVLSVSQARYYLNLYAPDKKETA
jgi:chromosome segregation ATPase